MTIKAKLLISISALILAIAAISIFSVYVSEKEKEIAESIVSNDVLPMEELKIIADSYAVEIVDTTHKVRSGAVLAADGAKSVDRALSTIETKWKHYTSGTLTEEARAIASKFQSIRQSANERISEMRDLLASSNMQGLATFIDTKLYPTIDPLGTEISKLIELHIDLAQHSLEKGKALQTELAIVMTILSVAGAAAAVFSIWTVIAGVIRPLNSITGAMGSLAAGDLDVAIYGEGRHDEIGAMASTVVTFRDNARKRRELEEQAVENGCKLEAISRAQAVIEFTLKGDILTANENFLNTLGYQLSEIQGKHHSMFCEPSFSNSEDYGRFWTKLAGGELVSDEFMRIGKGGEKVYIQASYNPIIDVNGKVFKVVKFATDVTQRVNNVDQLANALQALSAGDLTQTIATPFLPTLEKLRCDFNETSSRLRSTLQTISQNASTIAAASQEIQSASNDLSSRTEQQAASIEETAAALEEITTTVSDSSHRAQEAGQLVRKTKENAEHSGSVVGQAVDAMGKIEKSAGEIANIIGVIDEIAFQTNLLALNAGVEAARAGDAGKGFAVVAQEVRELAQRSAKAAKEIKELINASNEHVKNGVSLVGSTGKALQEIVTQVVQVDGNVGAIVEASREQATGLKEINAAVNTMDQGTQQNAAMVEETTAAAHSLAKEAEQLFELLGQFNIGTGGNGYRAAPSVANHASRPVASPTREMAAKIAKAFNGNAALKGGDTWEEF
ncbi:methyl-accepting chemotaxis protein [Rhizobium sp. SL42]|uniref:methyl-accepting chemotaxis protein n=1 Tax=Rhizobium sp. SL42 TaxID=2806346 RepID=UPI0023517C45|nr:methyl-accepting chemotaxis protein [Rhizobium sp. SL42]UJW77568.1 MCP four helix bundle domain-containing protein [Rhizobium sp. SL42]